MPTLPAIFEATQANFEAEVINASFDQPVLVDFWATWCEPCKTLGPLLEKVVAEYGGAIKLAKVDCDKEQQLAGMFGVRSIPTVVLVREGQLVDGFTGALPEAQLREFLARHVQPGDVDADTDVRNRRAPAPPHIAETPEQAIARVQQEIAAQPDAPSSSSILHWRRCAPATRPPRRPSSIRCRRTSRRTIARGACADNSSSRTR